MEVCNILRLETLENGEPLTYEGKVLVKGRSGNEYEFDGREGGVLFRFYPFPKRVVERAEEFKKELKDCCEDGIVKTYDLEYRQKQKLSEYLENIGLGVIFIGEEDPGWRIPDIHR